MKSIAYFVAAFAGTATWLAAPSVNAHHRLIEPPPRVDGEAGGNQLKQGPCGQTPNGRTDTISVFAPGETITVTFAEYIDHPSYYRIAFDVDGDDDFPLRPNESVSQDGDDPASINPISDLSQTLDSYILDYFMDDVALAGSEEVYTTSVTLPNVECEDCTLQVIQFMYNRAQPYYFQCADIALRAEAGTADGTMSTGSMSTGSMSTGASATTTGMASDTTTGTSGPTASSTTGLGPNAASTASDATAFGSTSSTTGDGLATVSTTGGASTGSATTGAAATSAGNGLGSASATALTGGVEQPTALPPAEETGCSCRLWGPAPTSTWPTLLLGLGFFGYRRRASRPRRVRVRFGQAAALSNAPQPDRAPPRCDHLRE